MNTAIITILILFVALAGGVRFYHQFYPLGAIFLLLGLVALPWAAYLWYRDHRPKLFLPAAVLIIPMVLSALATPDILPVSLSRILLFTIALAILVIAESQNPVDLQGGLWWAGLIWPLLLWLTDRQDNYNIVAVWSVVFCLVGLRSGSVWYILSHLAMLMVFGSRGAILGLTGGVLVLYHRQIVTHRAITFSFVALALVGMIVYRPTTALYRLHYWQHALVAWSQSPLFGVGSGGIKALQLIPEPGGGYQIHAHNIFVTYLTETGLIGLAALIVSGGYIYASRFAFSRWQTAIVTALVLHSLVDEPLWWPGPLMLAAAVAGARSTAWSFIPPGLKPSPLETNTI